MDSLHALEQHASQWQRLLDTLALATRMPGAYVARCCSIERHVLVTSSQCPDQTDPGARHPIFNLYCHKVTASDQPVLIENGSTEPEWADSCEHQAGIFSFLGYPIHGPDGRVFGTLGLYDCRPRRIKASWRELMRAIVAIIERELQQLAQQRLLVPDDHRDPVTGLSNVEGLLRAQGSLRRWGQSLANPEFGTQPIGLIWVQLYAEGSSKSKQHQVRLSDAVIPPLVQQLQPDSNADGVLVRWGEHQLLLVLAAIKETELQQRSEQLPIQLQQNLGDHLSDGLKFRVSAAIWDGHGDLPAPPLQTASPVRRQWLKLAGRAWRYSASLGWRLNQTAEYADKVAK